MQRGFKAFAALLCLLLTLSLVIPSVNTEETMLVSGNGTLLITVVEDDTVEIDDYEVPLGLEEDVCVLHIILAGACAAFFIAGGIIIAVKQHELNGMRRKLSEAEKQEAAS